MFWESSHKINIANQFGTFFASLAIAQVNMIELTVCIYQESRAVVIHVGRTLLTGKDSQWSVIDCHDLDIWILCCKFYMYGTSGIYSRLKNKRDPYPIDVFEFWTF